MYSARAEVQRNLRRPEHRSKVYGDWASTDGVSAGEPKTFYWGRPRGVLDLEMGVDWAR